MATIRETGRTGMLAGTARKVGLLGAVAALIGGGLSSEAEMQARPLPEPVRPSQYARGEVFGPQEIKINRRKNKNRAKNKAARKARRKAR